jgi:hypothetical protein
MFIDAPQQLYLERAGTEPGKVGERMGALGGTSAYATRVQTNTWRARKQQRGGWALGLFYILFWFLPSALNTLQSVQAGTLNIR